MVKTSVALLSFQSSFLVSTEPFFVISSEAEESLLLMRIKSDMSRPISGGVFAECYEKDGKQGKNGDGKYQASDDVLS
jgi:hypothetical protein